MNKPLPQVSSDDYRDKYNKAFKKCPVVNCKDGMDGEYPCGFCEGKRKEGEDD